MLHAALAKGTPAERSHVPGATRCSFVAHHLPAAWQVPTSHERNHRPCGTMQVSCGCTAAFYRCQCIMLAAGGACCHQAVVPTQRLKYLLSLRVKHTSSGDVRHELLHAMHSYPCRQRVLCACHAMPPCIHAQEAAVSTCTGGAHCVVRGNWMY
jgi:hypothetical protein